MHMYNFLCSDSLLYTSFFFFLLLSTLHGVYTRDCSWSTHACTCTYMYVTDAHVLVLEAFIIENSARPKPCVI